MRMANNRARASMIGYLFAVLVGACLALLLMGIGAVLYARMNRDTNGLLQLTQYQFKGNVKVPSPESGNAIVLAVRKVGPAAVAIETRIAGRGRNLLDPFRDFFDNPPEGRGSGVIIDGRNGYVLTNAHVVRDASIITCQLSNNVELKGTVLGADIPSDVAIVKVPSPPSGLPEAPLGSSENLSIGEWAIAIGNPFGNQHTVTVGVISAIRDKIQAQGKYLEHVIQTDAPINPGNSGGPLCNIRGEVIGINTAIIQYAQGIGYAIPIDTAKRIANSLIKGEHVQYPWIGVNLRPVSTDVQEVIGLPEHTGALVASVHNGSPAANGGVREQDVIVKINDTLIRNPDDVQAAIRSHKAGEAVTLSVQRSEGHIRHLRNLLPKAWTGASVRSVSGEERDSLGMPEDKGLLIDQVVKGSPADRSGLQAHDVILEINGRPVRSEADLIAAGKRTENKAETSILMSRYVPQSKKVKVVIGDMPERIRNN